MNRSLHIPAVRTLVFVFAIVGFPSVAHLEAEERPSDAASERVYDPEALRELTWIGGQAVPIAAATGHAHPGLSSEELVRR